MAAKGGFGDFTSRDQIMNAYSSIAATGRVRPEAASDAESFLEVARASVQYGSTKVPLAWMSDAACSMTESRSGETRLARMFAAIAA